MKKILTVVLCICVALTLTVSAMALSSPENKVIIREGTGTQEDGTTIPEDTFAAVSDDHSITVTANEKVYGKFDKWTIFVVKQTGGTGAVEYTAAKEGVDYTIVSGSLTTGTLVIKPISQIAVCGNYAGKTTDPAKSSSSSSTAKSPKHGDVNVMYAVVVMLAAGTVLLGAKRQLSK